MKRKIAWFMLVAMLLSMLCSCKNDESNDENREREFQILVSDLSDGESSGLKKEYDKWAFKRFEDDSANDKLTLNIDGKKISGKYKQSHIGTYNNYSSHIYKGESVEFEINAKTGELVAYDDLSFVNRSESAVDIGSEKAVKIAKDFLNNYTNVDDYTVSKVEDLSSEYVVRFSKTVCGYNTADRASVFVTKDGYIKTFMSFMLGKISPDLDISIDDEAIEKMVIDRAKNARKDIDTQYDKVEYSISKKTLTLDEYGVPMLVYSVEITMTNYDNKDAGVARSCLIEFVVTNIDLAPQAN